MKILLVWFVCLFFQFFFNFFVWKSVTVFRKVTKPSILESVFRYLQFSMK